MCKRLVQKVLEVNARGKRSFASEVIPLYNEAGLLDQVDLKHRGAATATSYVSNIDYNEKGQRVKIQYGNGVTTSYEYDPETFRLTRLLSTRNGGSDVLQDLNYTYDPVGNIIQITDNAQQTIFYNGQVVSPTQTFTYDPLYRLISATGREHISQNSTTAPEPDGLNLAHTPLPGDATAMRNYTRNYEYDGVGNILSMIHIANSGNWTRNYTYNTDNNQLLSTVIGAGTPYNYTHNEHGSMTAMSHLDSMDWNYAEQLSHITRSTTEAWYNYDGQGQRNRKVVEKAGSIKEERLYLGGFEIYRKWNGTTLTLERETLHVMDDTKRIAQVETKTVDTTANGGTGLSAPVITQRYGLDNHLGSASLELDESASIISYEEYYPYGSTSYQSGNSTSEVQRKRYRYTGKEKDEESGLYYHGARYYAAWLGRWTASDPIGVEGGINFYGYVSGNPVRLVDPSGTEEELPENNYTQTVNIETGDSEIVFNAPVHIDGDGVETIGLRTSDDILQFDLPSEESAPVPEDEAEAEEKYPGVTSENERALLNAVEEGDYFAAIGYAFRSLFDSETTPVSDNVHETFNGFKELTGSSDRTNHMYRKFEQLGIDQYQKGNIKTAYLTFTFTAISVPENNTELAASMMLGGVLGNGGGKGTGKVAESLNGMSLKEAKKMFAMWDPSTLKTYAKSIRYHAQKHGFTGRVDKYLRKAANFNKKGAKKKDLGGGVIRWTRKSGEFLIERNGKIVSYGLD